MTRKILAAILALAMVFALCLTACGNEEAEAEDTTAAEKETTKAAEAEDTTAADTEEETFELETIDWYIRQDMTNTPDFADYVWPEMQQYFLDNLNLQVEYHGFPGSDYATKFQAAITAGTGIDLMFMASNVTDFYVWYERSALEPLDDLLTQYAPELYADMPDYAFTSCTINGAIYGMPTIKDLCVDIGLFYNETMLEEIGMTDAFNAVDFENAKDLNDFFYEAKAARDEAIPEKADLALNQLYTTVWAYWKADEAAVGIYSKIDGVRCFEDQADDGVFVAYATEEYSNNIHMIHNWVTDNINPYDTDNYDKEGEHKKNGDFLAWWTWGSICAEREQYAEYGWTQELRHPNNAFSYTLYPLYCFHAINAMTTDAKKVGAMRLYNTLATDSYVATTMRFGVEGVHWEKTTDSLGHDRISFNIEGGRNADSAAMNYRFWYFAEFGDLNYVWIPEDQNDNFLQIMADTNANALTSKYMGFLLVTTDIVNEISACSNVIGEYHNDLMKGMIDDVDGRIDAFNATLEANGVQAIVDECNAQMTAWLG